MIRDNGLCLCPRCLVPKTDLDWMGQIPDSDSRLSKVRQYLHSVVQKAWDFVYQAGHGVVGACVDGLLKLTSLVPVIVSETPLYMANTI